MGFSCNCITYETNFYKSISNRTANCIAVFQSKDYGYVYGGTESETGYFVVIDTVSNFSSSIGDTIVVVGADGVNCGESLDFVRGDTVFLALDEGYYEAFERDSFYLDGCQQNYLKIKNGKHAGLNISQIKNKIYDVLDRKESECICENNPGFFSNVSTETSNCLAIFESYDYSYAYDGLNSQTGRFIIIDTIGNFNTQLMDTIVVIGEDGINCGEMLNQFSKGDTLFLALSEGYYKNFERDSFYLKGGGCGEHYLKVENGGDRGMSISEIKDRIRSMITDVSEIDLHDDLIIYPNPTTDILSVYAEEDIIVKIDIYDVSSSLIRSAESIQNPKGNIDIRELETGLYIVVVYLEDRRMIRKLFVKK